MKKYKCAVWINNGGEVPLTTPEESYCTDESLMALARSRANEQGLDPEFIKITFWKGN